MDIFGSNWRNVIDFLGGFCLMIPQDLVTKCGIGRGFGGSFDQSIVHSCFECICKQHIYLEKQKRNENNSIKRDIGYCGGVSVKFGYKFIRQFCHSRRVTDMEKGENTDLICLTASRVKRRRR